MLTTEETKTILPLVAKNGKSSAIQVKVGNALFGGESLVLIAGPCAVESREQIRKLAKLANENGATVMRGGAFKPRTSPYSFMGMGEDGINLLRETADEFGLAIVSEVMDTDQVDRFESRLDMLQIGSRNMQNFNLLRRVGKSNKPVLLKRGMSANLEELLSAAEYILNEGNDQVVLCERGIRTFSDYTRNTFDISVLPKLKQVSRLPIIADPSHATGDRDLVLPVARGAIAAGADGIMVEVHPDPEKALSDNDQSLYPDQLQELAANMRQIAPIVNRKF